MTEYLWMRIGDADDYWSYDNMEDAALNLADMFTDKQAENIRINTVQGGIEISPEYTGHNYISLYWGDDEGEYTESISQKELKELIKIIKRGY